MPLTPIARLALVAVVAVSACVARTPAPEAFTEFAANVQIAQLLAQGCPEVTISQPGMGKGARDLGLVLREQGFTPEDIAKFPDTLDVGAVQSRTQAFVTANRIDPRDFSTVCPVARREMQQGTPIAGFLTSA